MSDSGENAAVKYKWSPEATSLLVSVWSDRQVQKQFEYAAKPQIIWESVARYIRKKGYNVSGKQCRSRMKQVLVCYREAKRAGTRAGVEQYYEAIDRVLTCKRMDDQNSNGIDTVDATANLRSPPKDVKTNKNLQMRQKFQEPVQSFCRTEALSPTWIVEREHEYPDSPESNETIIARSCNAFSPTRDVAINTEGRMSQMAGKSVRYNSVPMEEPLRVHCKQNINCKPNVFAGYAYGEVPLQNAVQNVQNQIIQENMQQYQNDRQNRMWNPRSVLSNNLAFQQNVQNFDQYQPTDQFINAMQPNGMQVQNGNMENVMLRQNQFQLNAPENRAMPQEPRKLVGAQNFAASKQYRDTLPRMGSGSNAAKQTGGPAASLEYSPDVSQNLNDAFCLSKSDGKTHSLNETFDQPTRMTNTLLLPHGDVSVMTNNATYNDDSLLLDIMLESPTPSENDGKSKETGVNTDELPNAPLRKKKAQKLEQLVLSAINSQNEVVNKILAAQNDMVSKFLDIDRDRQNRLENRLDDLLKVVHATVLSKNSEPEAEAETGQAPPPVPGNAITGLVPPPKPGAVPPKLDLVPPKPCRVPCTIASSNVELINQNPVSTRPGVVSPITSPTKKPGTIWSKLGPVSQSPFVKAQQRLGIQPVLTTEVRTQSSAERRIAREVGKLNINFETLVFETSKLIEMEKQLEEKIENARRETSMGQNLTARRRLFTQREPTPAMILTAAFLEAECRFSEETTLNRRNAFTIADKGNARNLCEDDLLAGQGESYERLRQLNVHPSTAPPKPCDTSTPAKLPIGPANDNRSNGTAMQKPSIPQLAQLVMNSARWKENVVLNQKHNLAPSFPHTSCQKEEQQVNPLGYNGGAGYAVQPHNTVQRPSQEPELVPRNQDQIKPFNWSENLCNSAAPSEGQHATTVYRSAAANNGAPPKPNFPMGFTTAMLEAERPNAKDFNAEPGRTVVGFTEGVLPERKQLNVRFMDEALAELQRMYIERISKEEQEKNDSLPYVVREPNNVSVQSRQMIDKYMQQIMPKAQTRDNTDSENDEEFLDTTGTMQAAVPPRRGSLTSSGTGSTETAHSTKFFKPENNNCVIS